MQQLHLVGFTTDNEGLIFSPRKGSKSGGFVVPIDKRLLAKIDEAQRRRDGGDGRNRRPAIESVLSPREMQARLRSGRSVAQVAREAGVDEEWVERFAAPIVAEHGQVIDRARNLFFSKSRLGPSAQPLGESVRWNIFDKGVLLPDDIFDGSWTAFHLREGDWVVRFAFVNRKKLQHAEWEVDVRSGVVTARNRLAADLGYVEPGRRRRKMPKVSETPPPPPKSRAAVKRRRPAAKSTAGRRPATRKAPARTTTAARKSTAKKTTAKKTTARKAPAKKTTARKATARKAATKRPAKKRPAAKSTESTGRTSVTLPPAARMAPLPPRFTPERAPEPKRAATPTYSSGSSTQSRPEQERRRPEQGRERPAGPRSTVRVVAADAESSNPAATVDGERYQEERDLRLPTPPSAEPEVELIRLPRPQSASPAPAASGRRRRPLRAR